MAEKEVENKVYTLDKSLLTGFFNSLKKDFDEVIAPIKKDEIHIFDKVDSLRDVDLSFNNTAYPLNRYFFPENEELFSYSPGSVKRDIKKVKRVILGVRPCDINALLVVDKLFVTDPYYMSKRESTVLIALLCKSPGKDCFCTSVGGDKLKGGFDLAFVESGTRYYVKAGSLKGQELISPLFQESSERFPDPKLDCSKRINEGQADKMKSSFHHRVWEEEAERCLSCAACTMTCPTCPCFDVSDDPKLEDVRSGSRIRFHASCQLKNFTRVAGGFVFREERAKRLKHRIFHKMDYFPEEHKLFMCTGCGRCISNCPPGIDMVEMINKL